MNAKKKQNYLPKITNISHNIQQDMMNMALKQLYQNTQLLKKVYGIPDMSFIFQRDNQGALYIGNFFSAQNTDDLQKNNIKAVLTVAQQLPVSYDKKHQIDHLVIQALDADFQNLSQFFEQTNGFIEKSLQNNRNILVHCAAGISRSSTCTIAYMMFKFNKSLEQCIKEVRTQRKIINPNPGFIKQLRQYELFIQMKKKTNPVSTEQQKTSPLQNSQQLNNNS